MSKWTGRITGLAVGFILARLSAATTVNGAVEGEWTAAGSPYHSTGDLSVLPGKTLVIDAGVTANFDPDVSLVVEGTLQVLGTAAAPVKFLRADAGLAWGGVAVTGSTAAATVQHLELTGATVAKSSLPGFPTTFPSVLKITDHAKVHIENSWFHDFPNPVIDNSGQAELTILDSLIENCFESIHSAASYADIERVHIQHLHGYSDFIDFDNDSTPPSVIRDCLFEDNPDDGADGIDTLESSCLIENTIIKGVKTDKAFSLEGVSTPIIRNCLVVNCKSGLGVKDSCTPVFHNITVVGCGIAVRCYQKNAGKGGGHLTGQDLILWGNQKNFDVDALSSFDITYSDIQGGAAGAGNIDQDPLFVNLAAEDFHLQTGSPAIASGKDSSDMGCFPYTGPPPAKFIRGDAVGDGAIDITDVLKVLFYKFAGAVSDCLDAMDADDSGTVDLTDAIALLNYLFLSGPPPKAPFPVAGVDPSEDSLNCQRG